MQNTIEYEGWRVTLDGITEKQGQALALAAQGLTFKESARVLHVQPAAVRQRLDDARFKFCARTVRDLIVEAFKRGILAPLALVLMLGVGHGHQSPVVRRPSVPRTYSQVRIARKVDEGALTA